MNVNVVNNINACVAITPRVVAKVLADPNSKGTLTDVYTEFRKASILALKSPDGTPNVGPVYIGPFAPALDMHLYTLAPGEQLDIEPPLGCKGDLSHWTVFNAIAGDGAVIVVW